MGFPQALPHMVGIITAAAPDHGIFPSQGCGCNVSQQHRHSISRNQSFGINILPPVWSCCDGGVRLAREPLSDDS